MPISKLLIAITTATMLAGLPSAHAADSDSAANLQKPTTYMDDAEITAKVKTKFLTDSIVSAIKFKVETKQGVVYLSGQAKANAEKQRATELAMSIEGVKDVKNDIQAK